LHGRKVVRHDEGGKEEPAVRGSHTWEVKLVKNYHHYVHRVYIPYDLRYVGYDSAGMTHVRHAYVPNAISTFQTKLDMSQTKSKDGRRSHTVDDKPCKVYGHLSTLTTTVLRDSGNYEPDEKYGEGRTGPEATTTSFHEEHGGDGTDEKRTTANERHVIGLEIVETETLHESTHEVSNGVDTGTVERIS
jgi:hypothetical protein